ADKRDEHHLAEVFFFEGLGGGAGDLHQVLRSPSTSDRDYQLAAHLKLAFECCRHGGTSGGDEDRIEGRVLAPAPRAVACAELDIEVAQLREACGCCFRKARMTFDRIDAARDSAHHGSRIA